jgi:hypothetical protein
MPARPTTTPFDTDPAVPADLAVPADPTTTADAAVPADPPADPVAAPSDPATTTDRTTQAAADPDASDATASESDGACAHTPTATDRHDGRQDGDRADDVWEVLRRDPGCTATELARATKLRRTVVIGMLDRWTAEGSVDVTPGTGRRPAMRYFALPATLPPIPDTATDTTTDTTATNGTDGSAATASAAVMAATAVPAPVGRATAPTASGAADGDGPGVIPTKRARLASGALHGLVEDYLREHPATEHSPTAVGKALSRSSGAVANALERMVTAGWAQRTSDKPKRYRIAEDPTTATEVSRTADAGPDIRNVVTLAPSAAVSTVGDPTAEPATARVAVEPVGEPDAEPHRDGPRAGKKRRTRRPSADADAPRAGTPASATGEHADSDGGARVAPVLVDGAAEVTAIAPRRSGPGPRRGGGAARHR